MRSNRVATDARLDYMTPSTTEQTPTPIVKPIQKTVFDLESFGERTLVKDFTMIPVTSYQEFLSRIGNDTAKAIELFNVALTSEARETARNSEDGWHTFKLDENGDETDERNGVYSGTAADPKTVNTLVLTLAKTVFGYNKDAKIEAKRAAKEKAAAMIKGNPEIREGLKASMAAVKSEA